ncbi:MAG TPA: gamma-butyrobetaine hydroxylase-like domain-containing protein, partial [Edaphobacter sp.]|nr:gamma-butyrobetaine hydroxylase-like domain-containing protein [Edaphobacter sp.]
MSHEGIRFVSAEQAAKDAATEKRLPVEAVTPAKVRIHKTEGTGVEIDWKDGHKSAWSFAWLRHGCPCAICHEEREQNGRKPGVPKPKPQSLLP